MTDPPAAGAAQARQLFRYLGGDEWQEYRSILAVFAGTFFAEFSPDEVASAVAPAGIDPAVVPDRLESLRRWGKLTVSSSVGNPTSLDDYYRRRNRYLITRSGQEVVDVVERVLAGVDEIGDVQAGRLRDLHRALLALGDLHAAGLAHVGPERLSDAVRNVFDLHERFSVELTAFFAELNLWQSRYDLDADEVQFFAGVLVDYVAEQLTEIERMTRPIARSLEDLRPVLPEVVTELRTGLASRVDEAGLTDRVAVRRLAGTRLEDWDHLAAWFVGRNGRPSRLDQLTRQAVAAVRTLTANVTRLSRIGLGAASRRADFVRLARWFDEVADADEAHDLAAAAFGLGSCRHLGVLAGDADDPVATTTAWIDAPRANVPLSLRERGDTAKRGSASPVRDRSTEREFLRRRREQERLDAELVAAELLDRAGPDGAIDGAELSTQAFATLRDLISRSGLRAGIATAERTATAHGVQVVVARVPDATTTVACPEGRLTMHDLVVRLSAADGAGPDR
jgi:uncharacterized protein (TIGR02677 family)